MSNARGEKDYVSLVNGLITEASPLSFPPDSTADELNFVLQLDGLIRARRKGFDLTLPMFSETKVLPTNTATFDNVYYWSKPNLILFTYSEESQSKLMVHRNEAGFPNIGSYVIANEAATTEIAESTNLICITLSNNQRPVLLEYDEVSKTVNIYDVDIYLRDFELVDDDLQISGRPASLTEEHKYNLFNAGWYAQRKLESTGKAGDPIEEFASESSSRTISATFVAPNIIEGLDDLSLNTLSNGDAITVTDSSLNNGIYSVDSVEVYSSAPQLVRIVVQGSAIVNEGPVTIGLNIGTQYPSNADIPVLGLKTNDNGDELFSADTLNETSLGNTEAPRGHYVYNINNFDRDARVASPVTDGTTDSSITLKESINL